MKQKKSTILITGSSRGIGRSLALTFAQNGYAVAINGRHSDTLDAVKSECLSLTDCLSYCGNVGEEFFVKEMINDIYENWGHLDVLINNAGVSYIGLLTDMTGAQWQELLATNLSSVFYTCHAVVPHMVHAGKGRIINISSVWGSVGASCEVAYSASKGGVNLLTRALAKELAPSGICVNAISCGAIDTSMNQFLSTEERTCLEEEIPAGRFGTPEEVAQLAYSLVNAPSYLTGQIIGLDGGWC